MTAAQARMLPPTPDPRCGTPAGYTAHRRRGEGTCGPCRAARADEKRRCSNVTSKPPTDHVSCGTTSGAARHARRGERHCDPCRQARLEARRATNPVLETRPPRPDRDQFEDAACYPAIKVEPGVMLHDCRHPHEPDDQWQARLKAARAVCAACPVRAACQQLRDHYRGHKNGIDGILAGQPTSSPTTNQKDQT